MSSVISKKDTDATDTVIEKNPSEWKLVKNGLFHEVWQRASVQERQGVAVSGTETYRTWGFGLMPPLPDEEDITVLAKRSG